MEYLLKTAAVLFIFYVFYKLFLQRETFFQTNRLYLLTGLITAVCLPFIIIPVYVEYTPIAIESILPTNDAIVIQETSSEMSFNILQILYMLYGIGVIFFLTKLLIELTSLMLLFNRHQYYKSGSYILIETNNDIPPFSFFNWIVYNPKNYSENELTHILNHEKVHAKEMHSIDIMLSQLACIVFWFNPFTWLYKKEIQQNLEFIADKKAQRISECDKSYQLILLKSSIPNHKYIITNNFYNSQIKKRIIMLHKSNSSKIKAWKYSLILPILALFLMSFNTKEIFIEAESLKTISNSVQTEASSQLNSFYDTIDLQTTNEADNEEHSAMKNTNQKKANKLMAQVIPQKQKNSSTIKTNTLISVIDKNTTDSELEKIKAHLEKEGLSVKIKGVKRNNNGEITAIKIDAKSKNSNAQYNINSDDTIEPIKIIYDAKSDSISIGNGHTRHGKHTYVYETHDDGGNYKIHKSTSGSNVLVISDEEHEEHEHDDEHEHESRIIVRSNGKKSKVKRIKTNSKVHVISGDDDDEVIEIIVDDEDNNNEETIIVNGKKVNIVKGKNKNTWVSKNGDEDNVIILQNAYDKNNLLISSNGKNPLYIVDGKEVSKRKFKDIDTDNIESVTVLKGENAIELYGKKGKDGVIIVKTKKD
ncbi:M56 family metallopeptidase [Winogradskyella flava]|uniref:M56 family metallopeptidase n=1 Tax=Winogradskyella flava TaxID=1884876 RepID=UPI00249399E2|nr:M56 family metallopeptidase [Winogradskyella flava]